VDKYKQMKNNIFFILFVISINAGCRGSGLSENNASNDWKLFRGNPELSGSADFPLPENPVLMWTYKSDSRTSSSPVVNNGVTYWCDKRGLVIGIDINGNKVFEFDLQTAVEATPMIYDSTLYIGRIDGIMTAISLSKQEIVWDFETWGQICASANIADFAGKNAVVFGSYDNYLYCIDAKNGIELNRFESGYYLNGAVAIHNNCAVFGGCDGWLRIINCNNGIASDSLELDTYIPASPAIIDNFCYVGDHSGNIYEIQIENGKVFKHKKLISVSDDNGNNVSVPAITSKAVYFLSHDRYLYSIDRKSGIINWKYLLKGNTGESSPVICHDKIIVCTKSGIISIIDAEKGKLVWEYDTGEQILASPAVIKNNFFVLTSKGTLFCFGNS